MLRWALSCEACSVYRDLAGGRYVELDTRDDKQRNRGRSDWYDCQTGEREHERKRY